MSRVEVPQWSRVEVRGHYRDGRPVRGYARRKSVPFCAAVPAPPVPAPQSIAVGDRLADLLQHLRRVVVEAERTPSLETFTIVETAWRAARARLICDQNPAVAHLSGRGLGKPPYIAGPSAT